MRANEATEQRARASARALALLPYLLVTGLALALLWPLPFEPGPRSPDHYVHVARSAAWAQHLAAGELAGWSWMWFSGMPIGELYPPLGDLLVIAVRVGSFGLLDWWSAYTLTFLLVFAAQGWVLVFIARRFGLGATAGVLAAALALADPGFTREGGWMYTVYFGVWPQVLSTSLTWLGLALLLPGSPSLVDGGRVSPRDAASAGNAPPRWAGAGVAFAGAILAHPVALPVLALTLATMALFAPEAETRGALVGRTTLALGLAFALSAWWLLPMFEHRAWMASYGWLYAPIDLMLTWVGEGRLAQRMPAAVGYASLVGVLWAFARGPRWWRFVAVVALGLWFLTSREAFWWFRLDRISEGFTHIQYQRFAIAAKPAYFLLAASALARLVAACRPLLRRLSKGAPSPRTERRFVPIALGLVGLCGALALRPALSAPQVSRPAPGQVDLGRIAGAKHAVIESDYREALAWLQARWEERERFFRVSFAAVRNDHWFMDASLWLDAPIYKMGFTPGDNFVHKPEAAQRAVLDAFRVRYVVKLRAGATPLADEVARFGDLRIVERKLPPAPGSDAKGPLSAFVRGDARVQVLASPTMASGPTADRELVVDVRGVESSTELVFTVAGYPGWELVELEGPEADAVAGALEWYESSAWGSPIERARPSAREAGALRGGRVDGDTGREALWITASIDHDGVYRLRWAPSGVARGVAIVLGVSSVLALLVFGWGPLRRRALPRAGAALRRFVPRLDAARWPVLRLRTLLAIYLAGASVLAWRSWRGLEREAPTALGTFDASTSSPATIAPLKVDMLIRPALVVRPRAEATTRLRFVGLSCATTYRGWVGIDDETAPRRRHRFQLRLRGATAAQELAGHLSTGRQDFSFETPACGGPTDLEVEFNYGAPNAPEAGPPVGLNFWPQTERDGAALWRDDDPKTPTDGEGRE